MQKLYRVNWETQEIETATLLDEKNMNDGATVEIWLCEDSSGQRFTCSKFDWQLSELGAWQEHEAELNEYCIGYFAEIVKARNKHETAVNAHLKAKQRVSDLTAAKNN